MDKETINNNLMKVHNTALAVYLGASAIYAVTFVGTGVVFYLVNRKTVKKN